MKTPPSFSLLFYFHKKSCQPVLEHEDVDKGCWGKTTNNRSTTKRPFAKQSWPGGVKLCELVTKGLAFRFYWVFKNWVIAVASEG